MTIAPCVFYQKQIIRGKDQFYALLSSSWQNMELINTTTLSNTSSVDLDHCDLRCRRILIALYSVVLLGGTAGTVMMSRMMFKRKSQSMIATIIVNIIVLHSILLVTLPFRLSYYVSVVWKFGSFTCRVVSSIIYGHMYFTFVFYVVIVILRLLIYFKKLQMQRLQRYHAVVLSITVWMVGSLIFLPVFFLKYGIDPSHSEQHRCFEFYKDLNCRELIIINYSIIVFMMTIVVVLFLIKMAVIFQLAKTHWPDTWAHQEYRAQIKSLFFLLVIVVCFIPHHVFRIHFIQNFSEIEDSQLVLYNEICIALTTVCCLDMLCFIRGVIH
ncbi:probable G-protein coupled receptor 141 isoform X2 [Trichechus manatus latirostris]|uniref:Probable G-protein coupled receptor 141 isoform X2 n=2 Tax=Trichechus manatus latirostris TaxID=127582 RepID=A0A2Y9RLK4_TRIMA|nr:probable G-protein coupled receptor 141 isoform X2 [Trichechus manatus latirostris]